METTQGLHEANEAGQGGRLESVPEELRQLGQWVCWNPEVRDGEPTKVPYTPTTRRRAKSNKASTWVSFEEAEAGANNGFAGAGFVFTGEDPFCGIDLDKCRDPQTGRVEEWAQEVLRRFGSYAEVSPSGTGFHIFFKGKLPGGGLNRGGVEVYDRGRYFTITGRRHGEQTEIKDCQEELDQLVAELNGAGPKRGPKSQSEDDLAFCNRLAAQGKSAEEIDQAVRASDLFRPKWDEVHSAEGKTYGQMTIKKALDKQGATEGKGKKVSRRDRLIKLALDKYELSHDEELEGFASACGETDRINSKGFDRRLSSDFYKETEQGVSSQDIKEAKLIIEGKAINEGPLKEVHIRVAGGADDRVYVDLADEARTIIEVAPKGWLEGHASDVHFLRPPGMTSLFHPTRGGSVEDLRKFTNLEDANDFILIIAFLVNCFNPDGPYPGLEISGEQGSAKSTLMRMIKRLTDPSKVELRSLPRDLRNLAIAASNSRVLGFDNVSTIPGEVSNALCRLSTGGGDATRTLYENRDEILFYARRPFMINGINSPVRKEDLMDRMMQIRLASITEVGRKTESELWRDFEEAAPGIFGAILDAVSCALRRRKDVSLPSYPRMADFAVWVTAAEPALGWEPGTFLRAYERNRGEAASKAVDSDVVLSTVMDFMEKREEWKGTSTELLRELGFLVDDDTRRSKWWLKLPNQLTKRLNTGVTALRARGVGVFSDKNHEGRFIVLRKLRDGGVTVRDGARRWDSEPPSQEMLIDISKLGRER